MFLEMLIDSIRFSALYMFGSAGETITEKSGHLNLGTPGVMCIGAMGAAVGGATAVSMCGGPTQVNGFLAILMPLFFCLFFAGLAGAFFSFFTVTLHCNQNVTGLALTTFGMGLYPFVTSFLGIEATTGISNMTKSYYLHLFPSSFYSANGFTKLFFSYGWLVYLAIIMAIVIAVIMRRTRVGLFVRTVGENPASADAAGISVDKYRYLATIIGSAISGLGGLFYLFDSSSGVSEAGFEAFGWMAVSLVIFTMWNTEIGIAGSFLFSFLYIAPGYADVSGAGKKLINLVPYATTLVILVLTSIFKMGRAPAGLGQSYFREDR